jgi:hypothetical protein
VVVGENAAVDAGLGDRANVGRVHLVVDALRLRLRALRDSRLEIDDAGIRSPALEHGQGIAPDVGEGERPRDRAVGALGEPHVVVRRLDVALVEPGVARMREHLIDAPPSHHVAREEQTDHVDTPLPLWQLRLARLHSASWHASNQTGASPVTGFDADQSGPLAGGLICKLRGNAWAFDLCQRECLPP